MNVTNTDHQDSSLDLHSSIRRVFTHGDAKESPQPEPQPSPERREPQGESRPPGVGIRIKRSGNEGPFDEEVDPHRKGGHAEISGLAKQGKPEPEVDGHDRRQYQFVGVKQDRREEEGCEQGDLSDQAPP